MKQKLKTNKRMFFLNIFWHNRNLNELWQESKPDVLCAEQNQNYHAYTSHDILYCDIQSFYPSPTNGYLRNNDDRFLRNKRYNLYHPGYNAHRRCNSHMHNLLT